MPRQTRRQYKHPPILERYKKLLAGRDIKADSKKEKLRCANVILEVCLLALSREGLEALVQKWFTYDGYGAVIGDLQDLAVEGGRQPRR